jgi:hypothetical protein
MPEIWRVYRVINCRHTHPRKNKFVVIVCKDLEYMGFLINSSINQYISKRLYLLKCQVLMSSSDYGFLPHDSYLDCGQIYTFEDDELVVGLEVVNAKTKGEIKATVSGSKTVAKRYIKLILSC